MNPFSFYIRTISFVLRRRKSRHRFFGLVVREMHFEGEISDILQWLSNRYSSSSSRLAIQWAKSAREQRVLSFFSGFGIIKQNQKLPLRISHFISFHFFGCLLYFCHSVFFWALRKAPIFFLFRLLHILPYLLLALFIPLSIYVCVCVLLPERNRNQNPTHILFVLSVFQMPCCCCCQNFFFSSTKTAKSRARKRLIHGVWSGEIN